MTHGSRIAPLLLITIASTSESFAAHIRTETVKWAQVVQKAGIKGE